ncbi:flagellar filament capping protein FliD [Bradyrhizobium sp. U87765 SZCCT0131]|uniref:flagellar filament capping protein FliD n=1 Tax=unclassified Bradyrhizobium TaxID=2631580 RepID=UPI001BA456E1|nr:MULTISPECIES: flagellar filament capping protein FliD [unclassified Bradyrhizobium]MBR1220956.1 flagellar filament capping protein FliD [Bradyrhizobium sp. U87765 SZCCT0131]MBR1260224.1 flagellar filament capping protein FliD [Bradyrhizobium sp. U87765 SZCCT0134]MBR1307527.1 flagellar filament capping protein FliD [Bradyrhizobium sp. U87765 SZCCT0110]MBR1321481.1 flagellar filament capping protein FliD [Bradyrhizobium sp. U87765 SZCCT0109]MBR1349794.1 flagellar filament capping protein FliD
MTVSGATSTTTTPTTSSTSSTTTSTTSSASTNPSGVDWNALIQSEVNAMLAPATRIQTSVTANQARISAYQQLQSLLASLSTAAQSLPSSNTTSLSSSIFSARTATIGSTGTANASSNLNMSLNNGAPTGSYALTISQLAQAQQVAGAAQSSATTGLGYNGVFSVGLSGGASAAITVTSGMSLQDVASAINAQTSTTNVQASIVQVSGSQYELVLSGTKDGVNIATSSVSGDNILNKLGVTDTSGNFTDQLEKAQSAIFTLDGITLTRNTNDVTDVLNGVTFNLLAPTTAGTTLNVNIGVDDSQISTALQSLVTAYNNFQSYVASQQATNADGTASSSSVLFGDSTMNDIMNQLQDAINTTVGGLSLSDLGLSFTNTNQLSLNTSTLTSTLSSNLQGVEQLLAAQATSSSSQLTTIASSSTAPGSFRLDLAVDSSGNLQSVSVNGDSTMFSVSGNTILGNPGTPYAGMAFAYSGTTSQSISVTTTPGIAGLLDSISSTNSDPLSGSLQDLVTNLQSQDGTMQQQITDIQAQASIYQTQLQSQYAQYQAAIAQSTTTLNYLQALMNAQSQSS